MTTPKIKRISPFMGLFDDVTGMPEGAGASGQNWQVTREGYLRPGPFLNAANPEDCEDKTVIKEPIELDPYDLNDFAILTGDVFFDRINIRMPGSPFRDAGELEGPSSFYQKDHGTSTDDTGARWHGQYFTPDTLLNPEWLKLPAVQSMRRVLVESGVKEVWLLDDWNFMTNVINDWYSAESSPCGEIFSKFVGLTVTFENPQLIIYEPGDPLSTEPAGCMELTGNMHWQFRLWQGVPGATWPDEMTDMGDYDISIPLFATTGDVYSLGRDWLVQGSGVEQNTATDPDTSAEVPGLNRWPLVDERHLQEPNVTQLGICEQMNQSALGNEYLRWTYEVWQGVSNYADTSVQYGEACDNPVDNWQIGSGVTSAFDNEADGAAAAVASTTYYNKNMVKIAQGSILGQNLCQFIEWVGGPYTNYHQTNPQWNNGLINPAGGVNYETNNHPPEINHCENFIYIWKGPVAIPVGGIYRFWCVVDDGAYITIDGKVVLNAADRDRFDPARDAKVQGPGGYITWDRRYTFEVNLTAGMHDIEVRWFNGSSQFIWHLDICPKEYMILGLDKNEANYIGTDGQYQGLHQLKCYGAGAIGTEEPINPALCCLGMDSVFGCSNIIHHFKLTTEEWTDQHVSPDLDFADSGLDPTDCMQIADELSLNT